MVTEDNWLPKLPIGVSELNPDSDGAIIPELYGFIGGGMELFDKFNIPNTVNVKDSSYEQTIKQINTILPVFSKIKKIEQQSILEGVLKFESDGEFDEEETQAHIGTLLEASSDANTGYIMWVKLDPVAIR